MTKHRKGDCRCNAHKGMPDNAKNKKSSKKERKEPKTKDRSDDFLTPEEQKRLREKCQEIKRRVKEE